MKLLPAQLVAQAAGHDGSARHHDHEAHAHHAHDHAATGGIEWEDDMVDVNRITTPANTRWKLIDRSTDAANHAIQWQFRVGDRVKIRLVNEMDSDHPMHHPFHIHGAGRFLVIARDGVPEPNLVWSDTVLVRTGEVVDILLDVTNPGRWMAHCHIAEHHESGMMFSFDVAPAERRRRHDRAARRRRDRRRPGRPGHRLLPGPAGRRFTILEAAGEPAAAWRERWDSLRLFTPVRYDSLPGRAFPGDPDSYPDRDEVVAYLADYARHFELPVELDSRVVAVRGTRRRRFLVELADRRYAPSRWWSPPAPSRCRSPRRSPPASRRRSRSCTAPTTAGPRSCPTARWWSSGAATPATRSPRSSCARARCTWPSAPARRRCRSASSAATSSATWTLGLMAKTVDSRLAQRLKDRETLIGSSPRARAQAGHPAAAERVTRRARQQPAFADGSRPAVERGDLGDRLPAGPLLRAAAGLRRRRARRAPPRRHRRPRPVLPRAAVAFTRAGRRCWAGSRTTPQYIADRIAEHTSTRNGAAEAAQRRIRAAPRGTRPRRAAQRSATAS